MRTCRQCGSRLSSYMRIGDKKYNIGNRKFCLVCSPFGKHNTKANLTGKTIDNKGRVVRICSVCGRSFVRMTGRGGRVCFMCLQTKRVQKVRDKVHGIVGNACWLCGYDKGNAGRKVLDFHHLNRAEKKFNLTVRNMCNLSWDRVFPEIKKCVLVCCRCHRELEYGIISKAVVEEEYRRRWAERL